MADTHGGYRRPKNPAPVSGPGKLSKRTDGGPGQKVMVPDGLPYGDRQALMAQESTAAMSQADNVPTLSIPAPESGAMAAGPSVPFDAPTQRPNEPVTAGVNIGAGPGSEVLPMEHTATFQQQGPMTQMLQQLSARDMSGPLGALFRYAQVMGA